MNYNKLNNTWKQLLSLKTSRFAHWNNWFSQKNGKKHKIRSVRIDEAQAERNEDLYFRDPEDILQLQDEDEENPLIDLLYPVDPSDSNEEWIDHQDYIEESNEEELRCMNNAFEDDFCDSMADHLEFLNM